MEENHVVGLIHDVDDIPTSTLFRIVEAGNNVALWNPQYQKFFCIHNNIAVSRCKNSMGILQNGYGYCRFNILPIAPHIIGLVHVETERFLALYNGTLKLQETLAPTSAPTDMPTYTPTAPPTIAPTSAPSTSPPSATNATDSGNVSNSTSSLASNSTSSSSEDASQNSDVTSSGGNSNNSTNEAISRRHLDDILNVVHRVQNQFHKEYEEVPNSATTEEASETTEKETTSQSTEAAPQTTNEADNSQTTQQEASKQSSDQTTEVTTQQTTANQISGETTQTNAQTTQSVQTTAEPTKSSAPTPSPTLPPTNMTTWEPSSPPAVRPTISPPKPTNMPTPVPTLPPTTTTSTTAEPTLLPTSTTTLHPLRQHQDESRFSMILLESAPVGQTRMELFRLLSSYFDMYLEFLKETKLDLAQISEEFNANLVARMNTAQKKYEARFAEKKIGQTHEERQAELDRRNKTLEDFAQLLKDKRERQLEREKKEAEAWAIENEDADLAKKERKRLEENRTRIQEEESKARTAELTRREVQKSKDKIRWERLLDEWSWNRTLRSREENRREKLDREYEGLLKRESDMRNETFTGAGMMGRIISHEEKAFQSYISIQRANLKSSLPVLTDGIVRFLTAIKENRQIPRAQPTLYDYFHLTLMDVLRPHQQNILKFYESFRDRGLVDFLKLFSGFDFSIFEDMIAALQHEADANFRLQRQIMNAFLEPFKDHSEIAVGGKEKFSFGGYFQVEITIPITLTFSRDHRSGKIEFLQSSGGGGLRLAYSVTWCVDIKLCSDKQKKEAISWQPTTSNQKHTAADIRFRFLDKNYNPEKTNDNGLAITYPRLMGVAEFLFDKTTEQTQTTRSGNSTQANAIAQTMGSTSLTQNFSTATNDTSQITGNSSLNTNTSVETIQEDQTTTLHPMLSESIGLSFGWRDRFGANPKLSSVGLFFTAPSQSDQNVAMLKLFQKRKLREIPPARGDNHLGLQTLADDVSHSHIHMKWIFRNQNAQQWFWLLFVGMIIFLPMWYCNFCLSSEIGDHYEALYDDEPQLFAYSKANCPKKC